LRYSEATMDPILIPGSRDVSENFVDATEVFGEGFRPPCNAQQESILRKNRNYFTSGEDNLVFRGVNLYGEKQWLLIADRFLPERSINIISQRYAKLCFMLFQVHRIEIDKDGNLSPPPKLDSVDDIDEKELIKLQKVPPPAILNVHRWSMEEDITLLKAVALMGSMWAEIRARLIPHRDRGHLRKRYQVLERRIKATASRTKKHEKLMAAKLRSLIAPPTAPQFASRANAAPSGFLTVSVPSKTASTRPLTSVAKSVSAKLSKGPPRQASQVLQGSKVTAIDLKQKPTKGPADAHAIPKGDAALPPYPYPPPPYPLHPHSYHPAYMYPPPPGFPPYMAYGYYPPYYPPGHGYPDEGSRAGFEQLVTDPSRGWSQMAHVKSMMENETDVASTIVSQLAKSPSKPQSTSAADGQEAKSPAKKNLDSIEKLTGNKNAALPNRKSPNQSFGTEKSPGKSIPLPSPGPQTSRLSPPSNFKASNGDRMFPESPYLYPHSEFSHNMHSLYGYDLNRVFSNAAHIGTDTPTNVLHTPENSQLLGEATHLMDTDLEAVSALNLLKSPSKLPNEYKRNEPSVQDNTEKKSLFAKVVGNLNDKEKPGVKGKKKAK
jgi:Myb-like DNA-binding domain